MPKTKLLLGLVLNFMKWISEKYIHIHFRLKLWIINWIYNCIRFYPQAQPAETSSAHVKRILHFFSKLWVSCQTSLNLYAHKQEQQSLYKIIHWRVQQHSGILFNVHYVFWNLNLHKHCLSIVSDVFFLITPHLTSGPRLGWGWNRTAPLKSILTECFCFDVWSMTK